MSVSILALAEQKDGTLKKAGLETTTAARALADKIGAEVVTVLFAPPGTEGVAQLGEWGADRVVLVSDEAPRPHPDVVACTLAAMAREREAAAVLLSAGSLGKDVGPRLSARLGVPLLSDVVGLEISDDGAIEARRPVYAGKARWTVRCRAKPFLATLRPNVFTPKRAEGRSSAEVENTTAEAAEGPLPELLEVEAKQGAGRPELTEADIIVSGGRGLGGPENFRVIEELADVLGAAVGASRAAVDAGWRPHSDQVGQTGKTVSPNLYIACGISGAIQHLAGMGSSRVIVAINKDPEAPIFKVANYGIVGDLFEVVPALTEELRKAKG